jgi:hypothetical protein
MKMKRNEVYTPFGNFPMRKEVCEANRKMTDLEVLENLYVFGGMVVPEVLTEAIHRELLSGAETKAEIDAMIYEMKTGRKLDRPKQKTVVDLFKEIAERN